MLYEQYEIFAPNFNIPHNDKVSAVINAANDKFVDSIKNCTEQICLQAVAENIELGCKS